MSLVPSTSRRAVFLAWRGNVKTEFAEQSRKTDAAVQFNRYLWTRARLSPSVGECEATRFRQSAAGLLASIPCLTRKSEQADMMFLNAAVGLKDALKPLTHFG